MKTSFWEAFKKSTILQGLASVIVLGGDVALALMDKQIPEVLVMATGAIIGYWFGSKTRQAELSAQSEARG